MKQKTLAFEEVEILICAGGEIYYHINGKLHREDGPAVILSDKHKEWWVNGYRHREDGPAIEYEDGTKEWWVNGQRKRFRWHHG